MIPKAIFFDLDGTLIDSATTTRLAVAYACDQVAKAEPSLDAQVLLLTNQDAFAAYWPGVEDGWTLGRLDGAALSREVWRRALRACGREDEGLVWLAQEAMARRTRDTYSLYADTRQAIEFLRDRLALAVITNGAAASQREKLQVTGLESEFTAIAISGELGIAKPNRISSALFSTSWASALRKPSTSATASRPMLRARMRPGAPRSG